MFKKTLNELNFDLESSPLLISRTHSRLLAWQRGALRYELLLTEPGSGIARCVKVLAQLPSTNTVKGKESFDSRSDEGVGGH